MKLRISVGDVAYANEIEFWRGFVDGYKASAYVRLTDQFAAELELITGTLEADELILKMRRSGNKRDLLFNAKLTTSPRDIQYMFGFSYGISEYALRANERGSDIPGFLKVARPLNEADIPILEKFFREQGSMTTN